jgi:hypothetical protein
LRAIGGSLALAVLLLGPLASTAAAPQPVLWVTPLELDFGPVGVGATSPPQVVTITNIGSATLTNFAGGAPFDPQFGAFQNCAGGVAPGASCQYTFTFEPTAVGVSSSTSNSSTNAGPFVIRLTGEGVGPKLWVTPLELDFGDVPVGTTSPPQIVTITNVGLATLTNFAGGAPFDPQFGAFQNCAGGVAPGASCQYTFTFEPTAVGAANTTSNSSTNAGPFVIALRGRGSPTPVSADLSLTPPEIEPGGTSRLELLLSNPNSATQLDDIALTISLPAGVQVDATPQANAFGCGAGVTLTAAAGSGTVSLVGASIGPGIECLLRVNLSAASPGNYSISTGPISSSTSSNDSGASAVLRVIDPQSRLYMPLLRR